MRYTFIAFTILLSFAVQGQKLTGSVSDSLGQPLGFSTIEVKGKNISTTANAAGRFELALPAGNYTILCQHIGYQKGQQNITISNEGAQVDFRLKRQELTLTEVVVKKGEDPAYEIIRNAIRKRPQLRNELQSFTTEVYTKGQLKLRDHPKKFFGQKVDFEDGDTGKQRQLFLSETVSRYSVQPPNKSKIEVLASKVSGQSDGFGLSAPQVISFYDNNIKLGQNLSPRGFISPISDKALNFYNYKYEGAFFEEGRQISHIKVTPKRKFEPTFTGYINIVEDEWRIHSLDLTLLKNSGMELVDTLKLEQLYTPLNNGVWGVRSQVIYPAVKMFGFDAHGSFVNVYTSYNLSPSFAKGFFDNTIIKYTDSAQKKTEDYWTQTRPIVLQAEEAADYQKKDSMERVRKSPAYLDSIDRERNKLTFSKIMLSGMSFGNQKARSTFSIAPLTEMLSYNTVEGLVVNARFTYYKRLDTISNTRKSYSITPEIRYGFSNNHFNPNLTATYNFGKKYYNYLSVSGGSDVFQFNNAAPVGILGSTFSALASARNNLKIYEARFGTVSFSKGVGRGISVQGGLNYQDRIPLENTTDFSFRKKEKEFTPNRPLPQFDRNILPHQAFITTVGLRWQPGSKYIEFPQQTVSIGSKAPAFNLNYIQAIEGPFGSDVSYSKWLLNITDALNLKLFGDTYYRLDVGGFLNKDSVAIPDYHHYRGNPSSFIAGSYMDRLQLVPHYFFSNTSSFYTFFLAEHHFNGFITNKIPGLKQLKWNLVTGVNALYYQPSVYHVEPFVALENIFKVIRVDYIWGFQKGGTVEPKIRVGLKSAFLRNR